MEKLVYSNKVLLIMCLDSRMNDNWERFKKRLLKLSRLGLTEYEKPWILTNKGIHLATELQKRITIPSDIF